MKKNIKAVVILPDSWQDGKKYPVIYLLHGYSDNYASHIKNGPHLSDVADQYSVIIVCADGATSWYFDSPVDSSSRYETYIARELVQWVDKNYPTIQSPEGRAVTGLSMGGHGAMYVAFRNQDVFGAVGSMSGGVDIRPFPQNWEIAKWLGDYAIHPQEWEERTVINMLHLLKPKNGLAIIFDCGTGDFFYKVNVNLHHQMEERNIPHDFVSRPGAHNWEYWKNSLQYQILFFSRFFNKK